MHRLNRHWVATILPAVIGYGLAFLCVRLFEFYGWSLFLGLPVLVSFLSSFILAFRRPVQFGNAYWVSVASILVLGSFILISAIDGLICLLMALPLALLLCLPGVGLGLMAARACRGGTRSAAALAFLLLFPGLVAFERTTNRQTPLRAVTTSVEVRAPVEVVWKQVIAFPKITEPPTGIFRCGIAYPMEARIEGAGVGAVRHCVFSTGSFVEPITRWEEPSLLAFDVTSSPPAMRELSIYEHVDAPHLHGHIVSHRGQFQLSSSDGVVKLEGTTWYSQTLSPAWYWGPITDHLIHRIHERVLNHIKRTCEEE